MLWFEALGLREAILKRAITEEAAEGLLARHLSDLRIITAQVAGPVEEDGSIYQRTIGDEMPPLPEGQGVDEISPRFTRIARVARVEKAFRRKPVEFTDDLTGERHLEMVDAIEYRAYGEPYVVTSATGTGSVRHTQDVVFSGAEVFRKRDDGQIHQYGAATALLRRLLEVAALPPIEG